MSFQRAKITSAYWILFFSLIVSLTLFTLFFVNHQKTLLINREASSLTQELILAAEFVREDIAAERYQHVEQFFELWAKKNHKIISVKALAENGFVLAELKTRYQYSTTIKLNQLITGDVSIELQVEFDLSDLNEDINTLAYLFVAANTVFIIFLMLLLASILHYYFIKPLRRSEEKYINLAAIDPLTRINNRRAFYDAASREIARCVRYKHPLTMLLVDLDLFKQINDNFGHTVGDHVLRLVTAEMRMILRDSDVIGRLGGEEFAICLPELTLQSGKITAERIRSKIAELPPLEFNSLQRAITLSIGVAEMRVNDSVEHLLDRCDVALYRAKEAGRNCVKTSGEEPESD